MRFLVDAQLPPALARWLSDQGHKADHVVDLGLQAAMDSTIRQKSLELGAVIVTKDEDFVTLATLDPNGSPVVWVRSGNTTKRALLAWFAPLFPQVLVALEKGEKVVEIIGDALP